MSDAVKKSLVLFLAWNALIGLFWFWAREGSVVRLQLSIDDETHAIICNDELVATVNIPMSRGSVSGMAGLGFTKDSRPPLTVKPMEFHQFSVSDLKTGEILLDEHSKISSLDWQMIQGSFIFTPRNRIRSDYNSIGVVGDPSWQNYVIDVVLSNPTEGSIYFKFVDDKNYGRAQFRFWRELVVCLIYVQNGKQTYFKMVDIAEPFTQGVKSLVLRITRVYAVSLAILTCFLLIFILVSWFAQGFGRQNTRRKP